jgi:hypothetical protein
VKRRAGRGTPRSLTLRVRGRALGHQSVIRPAVADDHDHAHTPLFMIGSRDGRPAVVATK